MCGIVGYVGNKKPTEVLLQGLSTLEYRGYDSAGIFLAKDNDFKMVKSVGKIKQLEEKIKKEIEDDYKIGIAHTRWATHGKVNETNCHPHRLGNITLVHNGIIENYKELKDNLDYQFQTQTDTEVICALIDKIYKEKNDKINTLIKANNILKGSYALAIIFDDDYDNIYSLRKGSPLIIGKGLDENFIASDITAIIEYTKSYILLEEGEIAKVSKSNIEIYNLDKELIEKKVKESNFTVESALKGGYSHFMLKEIEEQIELVDKILLKYLDDYNFSDVLLDLSKYEKIDVVACGSAYHAGLVFKYLYEKYINDNIAIEVGSEYRYKKHYYDKKTLVVVISQSGETADTLASLRLANSHNVDTLAVVNVVSSSIAMEAKYVLPMIAGLEISVATTKGYFSQCLILALLILNTAYKNNKITKEDKNRVIDELRVVKNYIKDMINNKEILNLAEKICNKEHIYFIGRTLDYYILQEASLKLKEISYIHSEAYKAGELKHGSIALIDKDVPVISLISNDEVKEKTISNIVEAKTRGAYSILFTTNKMNMDDLDELFFIPDVNDFARFIAIIPFQMLSFHVANLRGCDIDKPRNLAKSVTVE